MVTMCYIITTETKQPQKRGIKYVNYNTCFTSIHIIFNNGY